MTTSSLRRQMKNVVNNYTEAEIKVREATSNDPWGASSSLMAEIANLTYHMVAFTEVMGMIWRRLNDHGKNWRHVYKALTLLDYLIKTGSERVVQECRDNIYSIQTLRDFQYIDRDGQDQGSHIREKAKKLVLLLKDPEKLKKERSQALKTKSRMVGVYAEYGELPPPYPGGYGSHYGTYGSRTLPSSFQSSSSSSPRSPRLAPEMEQARPTTTGEEELQLQLALAMSREESEKPTTTTLVVDEKTAMQIAKSLGKEAKKTVKRTQTTLEMDEDSQIKLAMSMSKEAHQQEQLGRQGDETMLKKALEESKREMSAKGGTAFMDLVDVFAPPKDPPKDNVWQKTSLHASTRLGGTDPWDALDGSSSSSKVDSSWMEQPIPNSPPPPWEPSPPPVNPWDPPSANPWAAGPKVADPFTTPKKSPLRPLSPSDGDLFDDAMDGGKINGQREGSPEMFDLYQLGQSLADSKPRTLKTPESFLHPAAASLVNLDSLIPANTQAKTMNPFLSAAGASATINPFQPEPSRLTLGQMGSGLGTVQPSLPYSASLPLPSNQPPSLPISFTHPTNTGLELPEPLLPFSTGSAQPSQSALNNPNPFL
ncbi:epsin-3 isoform X2 [Corythoichthys intestinalis]|uniref:epsin-3 isoform X2 n=1 Tax=Corythoichthys intestinalis TaxID=161448 RepID=UPI0025A64DE6|nr:epsin-3 isoform X2 [Corythoichthys intestinalis]